MWGCAQDDEKVSANGQADSEDLYANARLNSNKEAAEQAASRAEAFLVASDFDTAVRLCMPGIAQGVPSPNPLCCRK